MTASSAFAASRALLAGSSLAVIRGFKPCYSAHPLSQLLNVTLSARTYRHEHMRSHKSNAQAELSTLTPITLQWQLPYIPALDFVTLHPRHSGSGKQQQAGDESGVRSVSDVVTAALPDAKRVWLSEQPCRAYHPAAAEGPVAPASSGEKILDDLLPGSYVLAWHLGGQSTTQLRTPVWVAMEFEVV